MQDTSVCLRTLIKISGLPLTNLDIKDFEKSFIKQAKDFEDFDYGTLNKLIRFQITVDNSHPWSVLRASELLKWQDSEEYQNILKRESKIALSSDFESANFRFCVSCGSKLEESQKFCGVCGTKVEIN